jgi:hypothetical protein
MARKHRKRRNVVDLPEAISKAEDYVYEDMNSGSPKDYLNAPEDFLWVAQIANIPAENTDKFLCALERDVEDFRVASILDHDRSYYEDPIKEIKTHCMGMIQSLEWLDEYEGGSATLNCFFHQGLGPPPAEISGWRKVAYINGDWGRAVPEDGGALNDFKERLWSLWFALDTLSTKREDLGQNDLDPLSHGKTRTSNFMECILALCEVYGGNLTYNKHYHTGTLADIYEHFRKHLPEFWTDLSPATLQLLKKRSKE